MNSKDLEHLEDLVDAYDILDVLSALADICVLKAEHVRENWQDEDLADIWERNAHRLGNVKLHATR